MEQEYAQVQVSLFASCLPTKSVYWSLLNGSLFFLALYSNFIKQEDCKQKCEHGDDVAATKINVGFLFLTLDPTTRESSQCC